MSRSCRNLLWAVAALTVSLSACASASVQGSVQVSRRGEGYGDQQNFALLQRGRYLATLADCTACHSDPRRRDSPFGGGRPIPTPFGTLIAPNITPDPQTGIGNWTAKQFDHAVRRGRLPNGKRLYPAMPFPYFARMSAGDVAAIRAYLDTVKPVHHQVVSDQLPFPFSIRASMILWDWLYFRPGEWHPRADRSAAWNRGSYLVEGPGHCGACHTPKSFLGADQRDHYLQGYSLRGWFAPDLTGDRAHGLAAWTPRDIVEYLGTGHNRFDAASGPMAEEVRHSSSKMNPRDLMAIADYLKGEKSTSRRRTPLAANDPSMVAGAAIYGDVCSACHQKDGSGVAYLIPDLAGSAAVASRDPTTVLRVILHGAASVATRAEPTGPQMPSYAWQLDDEQVAAVANYVRNSWGHAAPAVPASAVRAARKRADAQGS